MRPILGPEDFFSDPDETGAEFVSLLSCNLGSCVGIVVLSVFGEGRGEREGEREGEGEGEEVGFGVFLVGLGLGVGEPLPLPDDSLLLPELDALESLGTGDGEVTATNHPQISKFKYGGRISYKYILLHLVDPIGQILIKVSTQ
jgi:hypothetical protein